MAQPTRTQAVLISRGIRHVASANGMWVAALAGRLPGGLALLSLCCPTTGASQQSHDLRHPCRMAVSSRPLIRCCRPQSDEGHLVPEAVSSLQLHGQDAVERRPPINRCGYREEASFAL